MMSRSTAVALAAALLVLAGGLLARGQAQTVQDVARAIEAETGGRVGLAVLDAAQGAGPRWRADERFPMMSTFKPLACAAYLDLRRRMGGRDREVRLGAEDLVTYSPVMQARAGEMISGDEACAAALRMSDNTAGNLVLEMIGGPAALTTYLRDIGDSDTRLDRFETELNSAEPGDSRDTSTPAALLQTYARFLLGEGLSVADQDQLIAWMQANEVSSRLLRQDAPRAWQIADRSGAGGYGSRSYVALIQIDGRAPVLLAAFLADTELDLAGRDAALRRLLQAALIELDL